MPRSIWSGSIAFGLVNIPVKLVSAVHEKKVSFHMLSKDGQCRLRRKLYCPETGEEYDFQDTARGYELAPGQYVIIRDEELDNLKPEKGRTIDISDFVDLAEIDPMYYDRSYLLVPDEGGAKGYHLLKQAMLDSRRVAIARFVMRQKQYLAAIRPLEGGLVLNTMHYAEEVTMPTDLGDQAPAEVEVSKGERDMAQKLIEALLTEFDPTKYRDEYTEKVQDLIEAKAEGEDVRAVSEEAEEAPKTYNLMEALKKSLAEKEKGGKSGKKATGSKGSSKSTKKKQPRKSA